MVERGYWNRFAYWTTTVKSVRDLNPGGSTSMSILAPGENAQRILYFGTKD